MSEEITSNSELEVGKYYHCFYRLNGKHSIQQCMQNGSDPKYMGNNTIWADDDNNQALERWRIFEVEAPSLDTIYLCKEHHGHGFVSDCALCKK